jgi:hypothetical protein
MFARFLVVLFDRHVLQTMSIISLTISLLARFELARRERAQNS